MEAIALIFVWIAIGVNMLVLISKILRRRKVLTGFAAIPSFRLFLLRLLGDGAESDRLAKRIEAIERANTNRERVDPKIFNRDIEKMLEEEVRKIETNEALAEKNSVPQYLPDPDGYTRPWKTVHRRPEPTTSRPPVRPAPQKPIYISYDKYKAYDEYDDFSQRVEEYAKRVMKVDSFANKERYSDRQWLYTMFPGTDIEITNEAWESLTLDQQEMWLKLQLQFWK